MKNQYVGDIGDYGKYSLLKAFGDAGVKVGINWYLTENDGSSDGKFNNYLLDDRYRFYDPEVFDGLRKIVYPDGEKLNRDRDVIDIENYGMIPGAVYYSDDLDYKYSSKERYGIRTLWLQRSLDVLRDVDLIFMDPDNGLLVSDNPSLKKADKYVLPSEVRDFFRSGKNVVYYCHKGRRKEDAWKYYLGFMLRDEWCPEAKQIVLTYHKGTQRSYVFLVHERDYKKYHRIVAGLLERWKGVFDN